MRYVSVFESRGWGIGFVENRDHKFARARHQLTSKCLSYYNPYTLLASTSYVCIFRHTVRIRVTHQQNSVCMLETG